jgi:hypothetical protein
LGQTVLLTAAASDPDSWYQTLRFSLTNSPAAAAINPATGAFSWPVTNMAALGTNALTVVVTDNGVPPMSDSKSFLVVVEPPLQFTSVRPDGSGHINFTFNSVPGQTYQLQYKNNLNSPQWTLLGSPVAGTGGPLSLSDTMTGQPQRFYRVVVTAQ